jgi:hypothetical protein
LGRKITYVIGAIFCIGAFAIFFLVRYLHCTCALFFTPSLTPPPPPPLLNKSLLIRSIHAGARWKCPGLRRYLSCPPFRMFYTYLTRHFLSAACVMLGVGNCTIMICSVQLQADVVICRASFSCGPSSKRPPLPYVRSETTRRLAPLSMADIRSSTR